MNENEGEEYDDCGEHDALFFDEKCLILFVFD